MLANRSLAARRRSTSECQPRSGISYPTVRPQIRPAPLRPSRHWRLGRPVSGPSPVLYGPSTTPTWSSCGPRHFGAVQFQQVSLDLAHAHAARVHADHKVIEARHAPLALGPQLRLETGKTVTRHIEVKFPARCQYLLGRGAVSAIFAGRILVGQLRSRFQKLAGDKNAKPFSRKSSALAPVYRLADRLVKHRIAGLD